MSEEKGNEALLQAFFARCPEMLFIAGLDGGLLQWSDVVRRTLGPVVEQGASVFALVHPDDRAEIDAAWARLRESADPVEFGARLVDARGVYRSLTCNACRSAGGDAIHASLRPALATGLTKCSERALLVKEQILDALSSNLPVCLWAINRDGVFIYHDGAGLERAGIQRSQFLGASIFDIYADKPSMKQVRQAIAGEATHLVDESHGVFWETWMIPVREADHELATVLGFTLDVSGGKRAEEELRSRLQQIEQQQAVIRDLSTPIIEVWDGVLTLPMVGVVDSVRTAEVMDSLLSRIVEHQARFAILDLTGVEIVDTQVASHLIQLVTAIKLLGAEGIVAGIKPNVAQTMVALGLDLSELVTQRNLRAALSYCIRRMSEPQRAPANRAG